MVLSQRGRRSLVLWTLWLWLCALAWPVVAQAQASAAANDPLHAICTSAPAQPGADGASQGSAAERLAHGCCGICSFGSLGTPPTIEPGPLRIATGEGVWPGEASPGPRSTDRWAAAQPRAPPGPGR